MPCMVYELFTRQLPFLCDRTAMEVQFLFTQAEVCTEIARARQQERPSHLPGEGSPPRTCEDEEGAAPEAAHPSPAGMRAMPPMRGTRLLCQHLNKREMEKMMHAAFQYWISQALRKKEMQEP